MKMKKSMIMGLAVTALCGCLPEQTSDATDSIYSDVPVELTGVIGTGTRGEGVIGGIPARGLQVSIFRAESSLGGHYSYQEKDIYGFLSSDGSINISPVQYYLADDNISSGFFAVYPATTAEFVQEGTTGIKMQVDGSTDIMASTRLLSGSVNNPIDGVLEFNHLLTKLNIYVEVPSTNSAELLETIRDVYGEITRISIDQGGHVEILFPTNSDASQATVSFVPNSEGIDFVPRNNVPLQLPNAKLVYGYALFAPCSLNDVRVTIYTTKRTGGIVLEAGEGGIWGGEELGDVPLDAGHYTDITIRFTKKEVKPVTGITGQISPWESTSNSSVNL
jgi:hypothetical protein